MYLYPVVAHSNMAKQVNKGVMLAFFISTPFPVQSHTHCSYNNVPAYFAVCSYVKSIGLPC